MSYILEALKKSEQERRRSEAPVEAAPARDQKAAPARQSRLLISLIVSMNLAVIAWLLWPAVPPENSAKTPAPTQLTPQQDEPTLASLIEPTPKKAAAVAVAAESVGAKPAKKEPSPEATEQEAPPIPEPTQAVQPATEPKPEPEPAKEPHEPSATLPELAELPASLRRRLPHITINVHVYSDRPQARFALIDLRRYQEGSQLPNGLYLEQITPGGLVFEFDNQRFLFPVR